MIKLNNKGWGLGAFFGFVIFLVFTILIVVIQANKLGIAGREQVLPVIPDETLNSTSDTTRNNVIKSAEEYVNIHYPNMQENNPVVIPFSLLIDRGFLSSVVIDNENCTGYVVVTKRERLEYNSYYNCASWTTIGYNNELDIVNES